MTLENVEVGANACSQEFIDWLKRLLTRQTSNYYFIFGRRESGKTNLSLLIMEIFFILFQTGIVATNVKLLVTLPRVEFITDLQTLRDWCEFNKERPKLIIIDEVGRTAKKRRFMTSINVKLVEDLQTLRKYRINLIYIASSEKIVDSGLTDLDMLDGFFDKIGIPLAVFTDVFGRHHLDHLWDDPPETSIEYDSYDVAPFTEYPTNPDNSHQSQFGIYKEIVGKWYRSKYEKSGEHLNGAESSTIRRLKEQILKDIWLGKGVVELSQRSSEDNTDAQDNN